MRYTKRALLIFGLGLVLGLAVAAAEIRGLARVASGLMALGLILIVPALVLDWRRSRPVSRLVARLRPGKRGRRSVARGRQPARRRAARRQR